MRVANKQKPGGQKAPSSAPTYANTDAKKDLISSDEVSKKQRSESLSLDQIHQSLRRRGRENLIGGSEDAKQ